MGLRRWFVVLFVAGLAPGIYQLYHPAGLGLGPGREMVALARNLVEEGTYGNSFRSMKTGPTATNPPLYPLFLALCIRIFRTPARITFVVLLANVMVNALIPALLPRISFMLWGRAGPGIIGGVLSILAAQLIPDWDADYTQLGLVLFCLLTLQLVRNHGYGVWEGSIAGAALGTLFLLNQVTLLVGAAWIGFLLTARRSGWRGTLRFLAPLLLLGVSVNLPWLQRNYGIWGKVVTRTNFGMTLYASNNDCAEPSVYEELGNGCYGFTHPESSVAEAALLKSVGEPAYDRLKTVQTVSWINSHPSRFFRLTLARIVQFWFPVPEPPSYSTYMIWVITILSIPGLFLMIRSQEPAAIFIAAVFLIYPVLYYIVVSAGRYRVPILWLSSLAAGYFLADLLLRRRRHCFAEE